MYDITTRFGRWKHENESSSAGEFLRNTNYSGVSGRLSFTTEGELDRRHSLYRVNHEKAEPIAE